MKIVIAALLITLFLSACPKIEGSVGDRKPYRVECYSGGKMIFIGDAISMDYYNGLFLFKFDTPKTKMYSSADCMVYEER